MCKSPAEGKNDHGKRRILSGKCLMAVLMVAVMAVSCIILLNGSDTSSAEPGSHVPEQISDTGLYWSYDAESHKLTISGSGDMPDYTPLSPPPWHDGYRDYIQAVEIGKDVSKIGMFGLGSLSELRTIVIEEGSTSYKLIGGVMYTADGTELVRYPSVTAETEFIVPDGVTKIGPFSFDDSHLEIVHIGKDVETIGTRAFWSCSDLTTVDFGTGSKVSSVEDYAFQYDHSLETFIFPGSIRTVGSGVFNGSGLQHLEIESVLSEGETSSIGWQAFAELPDLTYAKIDVTEIGDDAFENHSLETLIIGDHVKVIGAEAFLSTRDKIDTLMIGSGLETIRRAAFLLSGNSTFDTITLPEGLKLIGSDAFAGIKSLKTLTIPSTVENIENGAFAQLSELTTLNYNVIDEFHDEGSIVSNEPFGIDPEMPYADLTVNIGPTVRTIGNYLFRNCVNIKTLNLAEGVIQIRESAFENVGISDLILPRSLEYLGATCFRDCAYLESVYFTDNIDTVTSGIFYKESEASRAPGKMISAVFGDDVTRIDNAMFDDTLESVTIGAGIVSITGEMPGNNVKTVYFNAVRMTNPLKLPLFSIDGEKPAVDMTVTIGNGVQIIGPDVFRGVTNLKNVVMSNSVSRIYSSAFENTAIGSVVIPAGATVEVFAFRGCISLTSVAIHSGATIVPGAFSGISFRDASGEEINGSSLVGFMFAGTSDNMALVKKGFKFDMNCDVVKSDYYGIPGADTTDSEFQVERDYYDFAGWYSDDGLNTPADLSTFPDGLVTVYAKWTPITYDITYHLDEGENDPGNPSTYDMDNIPELKPAVKTGYTFNGWSSDPNTLVTVEYGGDIDVYAIWEINYYTIRFVNYDGTVLQSSDVTYGDTPEYDGDKPTRAADSQYTYTFAGWSPEIAVVTGIATYTATYNTTTNEYAITFLNYDGTELYSTDVAYGDTPAYGGEEPTKPADAQYTYTFAGWNPEIASVTGEVIYTAVFDPELRSYDISFVAGEGSGEMGKQTKTYGTEYPLPACGFTAPDHKEFKCWSVGGVEKDVGDTVTVNANITVTAVWQFVKYTVSFDPGEGTGSMSSEQVVYNDTLTLPTPTSSFTAPDGQQFKCWSVGGVEKDAGTEITVTGDITATALWEDIPTVTYEVTFNANGGEGNMGPVNTAGSYALPTCTFTAPEHMEFKCWSVGGVEKDVGATITVESDIEITAQWRIQRFTVTFNSNGGTEIDSQNVEYGSMVVRPDNPTKSSTVSTKYTFAGWYTEDGLVNMYDFDSPVTGALALFAKWTESPVPYDVSFQTNGGSEIESQVVNYGSKAMRPADPTKGSTVSETFSFAGWFSDPGFITAYDFDSSVTGDVILYAKWNSLPREYTIRFVDYDGIELQSSKVAYGATPVYGGETPVRDSDAQYTYNFNGWNPAITSVSGDKTYTATYTSSVRSYNIRFVDYDGTLLKEKSEQYGNIPSYGAANPSRAADAQYTYTFAGWNPAIIAVVGESTYTATYNTVVNSYNVTFDANGGSETANQTIPYGSKVVIPTEPSKASNTAQTFTFAGWCSDVDLTHAYDFDTPVTGDLTLYAKWDPQVRNYTISFVNYDGTVLQSTDVPYGSMPSYTGFEPVRAATAEYVYTFDNWLPEIISVIGEATYRAQFDSDAREYTLTFDSAGGTAIGSKVYKYGMYIPVPDDPTRDGFEFLGWDPSIPAKMPAANITITARWASLPVNVSEEVIGFVSDSTNVLVDLSNSGVASALADATKTTVEVSGNGWVMDIPKDIISGATGQISASAQPLSDSAKAALSESVKERIAGKTVYSLDLSDSNGKITFTGKKIKVSLPYELAAGQDASNVKVFFIDGENLVQYDATYDSEKKVAVFETEHFSDWFVDVVESSSGSNGGGFPIWIIFVIIAVVAAAGAGAFFIINQKKA